MKKTILVTGGAGFVGSNVSIAFAAKYPDRQVVAYDNFSRKGSELNVSRLEEKGVRIVRGDVRDMAALSAIESVEFIIDCAAEPSVMAGTAGSGIDAKDVIDINLVGTVNVLQLARRDKSFLIFLSTSRIYPIEPLNNLDFEETASRFELTLESYATGISQKGVAEDFALAGVRSLYGATKLCSELLIAEYSSLFGFGHVINRSGVIAGPWQFGKTDQGVLSLWLSRHLYKNKPLSYIGFGGKGKQVRDILHVDDLVEALLWQVENLSQCNGKTFQLGGGYDNSVSLLELTHLCEEVTGNTVSISADEATRPGDIKWYIADSSQFQKFSGWKPRRNVKQILSDTLAWMQANEAQVRLVLEG